MSDLQVLIESIRTTISFSETVLPDQIRVYAADYARACTELNTRMRQCIPRIREGNIAEAVRLAESQPNIFEQLMLLDFAERDEWVKIVETLGFDTPPALPIELSKELNDAYLKMSPLEPLLRLQRLYALNGSSIQKRITVLRAIAKADPKNTFWREDQEKFEKVRIADIGKEVHMLSAPKDSEQIRELYKELTSPDWIVAPPKEYCQTLCTLALQVYADSLLRYFAEFDYPQASNVYNAMRQIVTTNNMSMPAIIEQAIRAAVNWLNETEQQYELQNIFNSCLSALQNALETESSISDLERLYYDLETAASQAGEIIPDELEELYESEISRLIEAIKRRDRLIMVSVVSVCILFGGLVAWGLVQRSHRNNINETLATLEQIETNNRFDDIDGTIQRIETDSPRIANTPEVVAAIERLRTMRKTDATRAEDFSHYCSKISDVVNAPVSPNINDLGQIKVSVAQAEKLARTSQEKSKFFELKQKYDSIFSTRKKEIDNAFREQLTAISDEVKGLQQNTELSQDEIVSRLKDSSRRLDVLLQQSEVSPSLKEQGKTLSGTIAEQQKKIGDEIEQNKAFQTIVSAIPNWETYKSSLKNFKVKYPNHAAAADADNVLNELDSIKNVAVSLQELIRSYVEKSKDYNLLQKESPALLEQFEKLAYRTSEASASELFSPKTFLEKLSKPITSESFKGSETFLRGLSKRELFPWISESKWYYLTKKPTAETTKETYFYVTTFIGEEKKCPTNSIKDADLERNKSIIGTQYQFSVAARKKMDGIKDNAVEVVCNLMEQVLSASGIDPILKRLILELFISDLSNTDPVFASNFKEYLDKIQKSDVPLSTNWMDVDSQNTVLRRNQAEVLLKVLPDIKGLISKTKQDIEQFKNSLRNTKFQFEWIGLLSKNDGKWSCKTKSNDSRVTAGDIYILRCEDGDTVQPIKIGSVSGEEIKLSGGEKSFLQCLPIFIKK
jgi:hypothetical protein